MINMESFQMEEYDTAHFEIVLKCEDGEHRTVVPFPLSFMEPGEFTTFVCDRCQKRFAVTVYTGIPFLDLKEHPPARSMLIREVYPKGVVEEAF
jgi:hypothetical protein